ncbi:MAG: type II toxin-antitoxin system HicA family toxin [Phycisphaerales bacterium]|nr:type II toxin-antitoxin system HicA family toxin [Phycisphaerales bacterium]
MPSDVRFAVVRKLLEKHGYTLSRISGSHHVFTKAGADTISIPVHRGKVKPFYVGAIRKLLGEK